MRDLDYYCRMALASPEGGYMTYAHLQSSLEINTQQSERREREVLQDFCEVCVRFLVNGEQADAHGLNLSPALLQDMALCISGKLFAETARNWRTWLINWMLLDLIANDTISTWKQLMSLHPMQGGSYKHWVRDGGAPRSSERLKVEADEARIVVAWIQLHWPFLGDCLILPANQIPHSAADAVGFRHFLDRIVYLLHHRTYSLELWRYPFLGVSEENLIASPSADPLLEYLPDATVDHVLNEGQLEQLLRLRSQSYSLRYLAQQTASELPQREFYRERLAQRSAQYEIDTRAFIQHMTNASPGEIHMTVSGAAAGASSSSAPLEETIAALGYTNLDIARLLQLSLEAPIPVVLREQHAEAAVSDSPELRTAYRVGNRYILPPVHDSELQNALQMLFAHEEAVAHPPAEILIPLNSGMHWMTLRITIEENHASVDYVDSLYHDEAEIDDASAQHVRTHVLTPLIIFLRSQSFHIADDDANRIYRRVQPDAINCGGMTVENILDYMNQVEAPAIPESLTPRRIAVLRETHKQLLEQGGYRLGTDD